MPFICNLSPHIRPPLPHTPIPQTKTPSYLIENKKNPLNRALARPYNNLASYQNASVFIILHSVYNRLIESPQPRRRYTSESVFVTHVTHLGSDKNNQILLVQIYAYSTGMIAGHERTLVIVHGADIQNVSSRNNHD